MPTYFATGVTGTLSICELRDAVSNVIDFQCHPEQRTDAERMKKAIDGATPLSERVIGGDGAAKSVVHYLGAQADMPMKMVVASMRGNHVREIEGSDPTDVDETTNASKAKPVADAMLSSSIGSPLTSLGATPTPTQMSFNTSPLKAVQNTQPNNYIASPPSVVCSTEELPQGNYTNKPQALILNIKLTSKSFMPVESESVQKRKLFDNKDLKVEVFINGELVEVEYVAGRRLHGKIQSIELQYKGTRLHRQIEKPWAYMPSQINTGAAQDAPGRWSNVSEALKRESAIHGSDKYGDVPPSGEYLMALSQLALPANISDCKGLGVVDVIITAGKGQKYGSEVEYLTAPTRMDDDAYMSLNPIIDPELMFTPVARPSTSSSSLFVSRRDSPPEIPLAQLRTRATKFVLTTPASRSQRTEQELKDNLGLNVDLKKTRVDSFENARGRGNGKGRSLTQRLGDVKKMSPQKQETEIAMLREEFGGIDGIDEPARKKLKFDVPAIGIASQIEQPINLLAPEGTMSPIDMFKPSTPTHITLQTLTAATGVDYLTQSRVNLAQELGADPNGYLMDQITSSAPPKVMNTPLKRTKASALANSPTRVPVKVPKSYGRSQNEQQTQANVGEWDDTPIPFTMNVRAATKANRLERGVSTQLASGKPSRGAGRTSKKWLPSERTAAEALAEFEVPASSVGSCVTYAPDLGVVGGGGAAVRGKVQRQVAKTRKGEFREQEVVVGFRFCVV